MKQKQLLCWYVNSCNEMYSMLICSFFEWAMHFIHIRGYLRPKMHIAQKMVFVYSILGFSILQNAMYFVIQTTHFVNEIHISFCDTMHNDIFKKKKCFNEITW